MIRRSMLRCASAVGLALLFATTCATTASAQTPPAGINGMAETVRATYKPFQEDVRLEGRNKVREDLVFHTRASWDDTLQKHLDAYRWHTVLPGGITVKGYFVVPNKRIATFTLMQNNKKWMLVMHDDPDGARFVLWGHSFSNRDRYKSQTPQRPFHRGHPKSPTVRYPL